MCQFNSFYGRIYVGYELGKALVSTETNLKLGGIGLGLIVLSYNFSKSSFKKVRRALNTYNNGL